jgi:probable RNA-binding protein EIF1AD
MSKRTKRKHVFKEVLDDDMSLPTDNQTIVRIKNTRGNNLHEVCAPDQSSYLASMPTKFRKNVWVKRGTYVLVEPIEEGVKVKAEIVRILSDEHIKYFKKDNVWPSEFDDSTKDNTSGSDEDLVVNTNRRLHVVVSSDESSTSESDEVSDRDDSDEVGDRNLNDCDNKP